MHALYTYSVSESYTMHVSYKLTYVSSSAVHKFVLMIQIEFQMRNDRSTLSHHILQSTPHQCIFQRSHCYLNSHLLVEQSRLCTFLAGNSFIFNSYHKL